MLAASFRRPSYGRRKVRIDSDTVAALRPWFPDLDLQTVELVERGPVCWYVRNVVKQGAMTIAPFVFFGREHFDPAQAGSVALVAHELKHVEQYRAMGHARFLAQYLADLARNRFQYSRELPLEAPAYE